MSICLCCKEEFKNNKSLARHIGLYHSITKRQYYDFYIKKPEEGKCISCGEETAFRGNKYLKYCSLKCYSSSEDKEKISRNTQAGKKQSQETINKRVQKIDYKSVIEKRTKTTLSKNGTLNPLVHLTEEQKIERALNISNKLKGRKHTKAHHEKVIESKIKNGTVKHTEETKRKISASLNKAYQQQDPPITIGTSVPKGYKSGYFNGVFYRSSYELIFLKQCFERNIKVESAETKEWRIPYHDASGRKRFYYPDFFLPYYKVIVEIKPVTMLHVNNNMLKLHAAFTSNKAGNFAVITEEELFGNYLWVDNIKHFLL